MCFGAQKKRLIETVLLSTQNIVWLRNMKYDFSLRTLIWRPRRSYLYVICKLHLAFLSPNAQFDQVYTVALKQARNLNVNFSK